MLVALASTHATPTWISLLPLKVGARDPWNNQLIYPCSALKRVQL
jgi:hypothetical protein